MPLQVRRVITANKSGKSIIDKDDFATNIDNPLGLPNAGMTNLWVTKSCPANIDDYDDLTEGKIPLDPPEGGVVFRIVDFPPESTYLNKLSKNSVSEVWEKFQTDQSASQVKKALHPFMHKTSSVDYGIVLSGEIVLILDDSETLLKEGDVVIQRATNHAWSNRSDRSCRMVFVLINGVSK